MKKYLSWVLVCVFLISLLPSQTAQAARGVPGSPDLGYGAWLNLSGKYFDQGLSLLPDLNLDWVAIEVDWAEMTGTSKVTLNTSRLDLAVSAAVASNTAVMLSLTNPPEWDITDAGPDAAATAELIRKLWQKYGEKITAVELFPGANTSQGWKANPNPADYAELFLSVDSQLVQAGSSILLIAGGLRPLSSSSPGTDWNDLDFLRGLYAAGAKDWMPVLSIQFSQLTGSPLQTSSGSGTILRHYEAIRQVMLDFDHANSLLWVTRINAPDGTIIPDDKQYSNRQHQTEWLQQALIQVRSQLYMGVVIAHNLNPAESNHSIYGRDALVLDAGSIHPFYSVFKAIIHQTNPESGTARPGMPKSTNLLKCKYKT
ncbi:MAG: hypothetical protein ACYDGL_13375 [Bellilinea sp.]